MRVTQMGGKCYVLATDVLSALQTESKRLTAEHDGHAARAVATVTDSLLDEVTESRARAEKTRKRAVPVGG